MTDNGGHSYTEGMDDKHISKMIEDSSYFKAMEQAINDVYNKAIDDAVAFITDWYENERYFEDGKDFYAELNKLKK